MVAPIQGLWGVLFFDHPGPRPGLTEVAALRLAAVAAATRRRFDVAFAVRGLKTRSVG
jgi:hypothetical protein